MNILDMLATTENAATTRKYKGLLASHPSLRKLITKYYNSISDIKPLGKGLSVNKKKLSVIVFSTFQDISIQIALSSKAGIKPLIGEILCLVRQQHIQLYNPHGEAFDNALNEILVLYCTFHKTRKNDFPALLLAATNKNVKLKNPVAIMQDVACSNYLRWTAGNARMMRLERILNETDFFLHPIILKKFFRNTKPEVVLPINQMRIRHVSLLLRMLRKMGWIETLDGKAYLEMAAMHITYRKKQVTPKRLSRIGSNIMKNPDKYKDIIKIVSDIIAEVETVGK